MYFNEVLDSHFINHMEQKIDKVNIKRIDAGAIDELIDKGEKKESVLSKEDQDGFQGAQDGGEGGQGEGRGPPQPP